MSRKLSLCLFVACLFQCQLSVCQTIGIDSLKHRVTAAKTNREKLDAILGLCSKRLSLSTDTLFKYAVMAKDLSEEEHDRHSLIFSDYYFTNYLIKKGNSDSALTICNSYIRQLKDDPSEDRLYLNFVATKAGLLIKLNQYKESFAEYYFLQNESEKRRDTLNELLGQMGLGWVNMEMDQNVEAIRFLQVALENPIARNTEKYGEYISFIYSNIAAAYNDIGRNDSAEYFIDLAIPLARKFENLTSLANALAIKADILSATNRNKDAEKALVEVVMIRKQIGDPFFIVSDMSQLAVYYYHNNQPQKGVAVCLEGIAMAEQNHLVAKLPLLYEALAENYDTAGDYKNYAETLRKIITLKDSTYKKNSEEALAAIEGKYEVQKKENIIVTQHLALVKNNYLLFGSLLLFLLVSISALLLFRVYSHKQKLKASLAMHEEKQLSAAAVIHAEEKERKRIASDLHDNMGAYATAIIATVDEMIANQKTDKEAALANLKTNAIELMSNLRDTIWASYKEKIYLTGISDRFKNYARKILTAYPKVRIEVSESIIQDVSFLPVQALNIFRIIQEACTNALKHSGSDQIEVVFESDICFKIIIRDFGTGIRDPHYLNNGNGVKNMQSRASAAGLHFCISGNEPHGTQIAVTSDPILQI